MAAIDGGVVILGFISPTSTQDDYAVIDPIYGIDGLRNYSGGTEVLTGTTITSKRRRAGMIVGINNGTTFYKLKPGWSESLAMDNWELFSLGSTFTGGTVSGATNFTGGLTANTISATTITANTISATTYNGYIPLPTTAGSTTATTITFITDRIYGTPTLPISGATISGDTTSGQTGVTNIIIHKNLLAPPTFDSIFKKRSGSSSYVIGVLNYIDCTFINTTNIIYSINQVT